MYKIRVCLSSPYGIMHCDSKSFMTLDALKQHIYHQLSKNENIIKGKVYPIFQGNTIIMQCLINENIVTFIHSPIL